MEALTGGEILRRLFREPPPGSARRSRSGLTVVRFAQYLNSTNQKLPGRDSVEDEQVRRHIDDGITQNWSIVKSAETISLVVRFYEDRGDHSSAGRLRSLVAASVEASPWFPFRHVVLLGDEHLRCAADPYSASEDTVQEWRIRCMYGDVDLYRASLSIFVSRHLPALDVRTTEARLLELAIHLARVCITYGDYAYAKRICHRIIHDYGSNGHPEVNLTHFFDAERLHAEASSFVRLENQLPEFVVLYGRLQARLELCRGALGDDYRRHRLDYLDVLIRTITRLEFISSGSPLQGNYELADDTREAIEKLNVQRELNALERRLLGWSKTSGTDHNVRRPNSNTDDFIRADHIRYVYCDTYIRGLAVLRDDPVLAYIFSRKLSGRVFRGERVFQDVYDRLGMSREGGDPIRHYRRQTTRAMIHCQEASRLVRDGDRAAARREAEAAKHCIRRMIDRLTDDGMYHTRHLVSLITVKLASLEESF